MITEVMITEDYVSFEMAKLLKEKGFNERIPHWYDDEEFLHKNTGLYLCNSTELDGCITAPTLQMAMKWLREVYGLFIRITEDITGNVFEWSVYQKNYGCKASTYVEDSYEEACEAAIKYCLDNLI